LTKFAALKDLVIKIGAFLKQSFKELQSFTDLLEKHEQGTLQPIKVIESRWFLILRGAKVIEKLCPYLQGRFPNCKSPILMKLTGINLYEKCIKNRGSIFAKLDILSLLCSIL
jgi:hypothetical protein